MTPQERELWDAVTALRRHGVHVYLAEGEGIASLWNVGDMRKVGFHEIVRLARKMTPPQMDASMFPIQDWPELAKDAFR